MNLDTKCIPLGHIQTYFNLKQAIESDPARLVNQAAILLDNPEEVLHEIVHLNVADIYAAANVDLGRENGVGVFVSTRQVMNIIDQTMNALRMPHLGLLLGSLMAVSHHGIASLAAITRPTLWDCGETLSRFCSELFPPLNMSVTLSGNDGWLAIEERIPLVPLNHFFAELHLVSFYNILRDLVANDVARMPYRIEIGYPEPEWGYLYRHCFSCPVIFGSPLTRIIANSSAKDAGSPSPRRQIPSESQPSISRNISSRTIKYLPLKLRRRLLRYCGAFPSLENAANDLGMSGRTMRRKLKDEGTSYQQELDFVRQKFAIEYFERGGVSITELAYLLGFADSSAFAKAFRRWTSMSPKEYATSIQLKSSLQAIDE